MEVAGHRIMGAHENHGSCCRLDGAGSFHGEHDAWHRVGGIWGRIWRFYLVPDWLLDSQRLQVEEARIRTPTEMEERGRTIQAGQLKRPPLVRVSTPLPLRSRYSRQRPRCE